MFSVRELTVHRRRTIASIAVMAVSAMYLVAVIGIFGSITGSVNRLADGIAGIAALEVSGITDAGFPDTIATDVAAVPGVATAAPMIRMSVPTASGQVLLLGADTNSAALRGALKDVVAGPVGGPSGVSNGVQVGPGVGHKKGETFQLGSGLCTVAAVLEGQQLADLNGGQYVLAPLPLAQNVTGRHGQLDSILITTKPGADLAKVRSAVTAVVNGRAIVADPSVRAARAGDGVKMMNYMALTGAAVALVVGSFLIYTTMTMAITQRRPVISMLRAIGGRRTTIVRDMLAEAAILGLIGGATGSAAGIFLGRVAIGRLPPAVTQGLEARVEYWLPVYAIPAALRRDSSDQRGRLGDGCPAGVQGCTHRGIGACRGFGRGRRATPAADRMRGWSGRGVRGVNFRRGRPTRRRGCCRDVCSVLCRDRARFRAHHADRESDSRIGSNVQIGWGARRGDN